MKATSDPKKFYQRGPTSKFDLTKMFTRSFFYLSLLFVDNFVAYLSRATYSAHVLVDSRYSYKCYTRVKAITRIVKAFTSKFDPAKSFNVRV